jgi:hypothetical protein
MIAKCEDNYKQTSTEWREGGVLMELSVVQKKEKEKEKQWKKKKQLEEKK